MDGQERRNLDGRRFCCLSNQATRTGHLSYRDYTIVGMPPPSSGGVHVAQILNILENFDLQSLYQDDPAQFTHVVAEAMNLAFADRAHWLGDADFANVPRGIVGKEYAAELAKRIDLDRATSVDAHGTPPGHDTDFFRRELNHAATSNKSTPPRHSAIEKHTTHVATADAAGNWVAITATVNTSFGSKVIVPGTGLPLNNEMDDFSIATGCAQRVWVDRSRGERDCPGKRPLSSMSPTIVLHDGKPVLTCGAAGGPKIITQVVLTIVRVLDLGPASRGSGRQAAISPPMGPATAQVRKGSRRRPALGLGEPGTRNQPNSERRRHPGHRPLR